MIDFSQFDSLIAMTMYFNNDDTCKNAIVETRSAKANSRMLFALIVEVIIVQSVRMVDFAVIVARTISLAK